MKEVNIIFPHQLFEQSPLIENGLPVCLVEEYLFFRQYAFHKQKIAFHRASMKCYESYLGNQGISVSYIESGDKHADIRKLLTHLAAEKVETIHLIDPTDNWLEKRIRETAEENKIAVKEYENPLFLNTREELSGFFRSSKKKFYQTRFYKDQRKKRNILLDEESKPVGGKWSFDAENRKKYPNDKVPPDITYPSADQSYREAVAYTEEHFADNPGTLSSRPRYPFTFEATRSWLQDFLKNRFRDFGAYEDAIVEKEDILHHSVLTPMLNTGLISPKALLRSALSHAASNDVPINSTEGFTRQIIGWREFIRGIYQCKGSEERTTNFWGFERKIPASFYDGSTGIDPLDITIKKVLATGYCHHIERLMILGNFMLLCEFDPDEVYRWFMELFIDAYDWVMVPNVYGMSQFADGGLMSTKPYISSSNYLMKMSDFARGDWQEVWDALFWRFMNVHRSFFTSNPRMGMLVGTFDKMSEEKQNKLMSRAEEFLSAL